MVTGRASYTTLERISELERLATDHTQPEQVRDRARAELVAIDAGGSVKAAHQRTRAELSLAEHDLDGAGTSDPGEERERAQTEADALPIPRTQEAGSLQTRANQALARANSARENTESSPSTVKTDTAAPQKYPVRAFLMTWGELAEWWVHYDVADLAAELTDEQLNSFLAVADGTATFAHQLRALRQTPGETGRHLHAV